jgi:hypothetical protein
MTTEEIIEMAEKVYGECDWNDSALTHLEQFAELVAEHEREACAKMCDYVYENIVTDEHIKAMAFKIRARGQE